MIAPSIGVLLSADRGNPLYVLEILKQQGYFFERLAPKVADSEMADKKIVIIYGPFKIERQMRKTLHKFAHRGGAVIIAGDVEGADDLTGTQTIVTDQKYFGYPVGGTKGHSLGEGYLELTNSALPLRGELLESWFPLHGFGCTPLKIKKAEVLAEYIPTATPTERFPAVTAHIIGKGKVIQFAPHLAYTVRRIQEGIYIDQDGIPAPDGMAPLNDGILKAEDGMVLDWDRDRRLISPKHRVPAFMVPVADVWRALFSNTIDLCADFTGAEIKKVDYWPGGAEFIFHISHDTDGNNHKLARKMLERVNSLGIKTTWCIIPPGYNADLCREIESHGHELAFHFDAQSYQMPDVFSLEMFEEQLAETYETTGVTQFVSNKNHYTRWEQRNEFFQWLAKNGILSDQSKGPSKCGTTGFPFGSAHPWFPMDDNGHLINCLEVSFQCQDLGMQGPDDIGPEIVQAVKAISGVCHLIFHPAHTKNRQVQKKFDEIVQLGRQLGAKFMRNADIVQWVLARRSFIEQNGSTLLDEIVIKTRKNGIWI